MTEFLQVSKSWRIIWFVSSSVANSHSATSFNLRNSLILPEYQSPEYQSNGNAPTLTRYHLVHRRDI